MFKITDADKKHEADTSQLAESRANPPTERLAIWQQSPGIKTQRGLRAKAGLWIRSEKPYSPFDHSEWLSSG